MRIAFAPAARVLSEQRPNGEALIAMSLMRRLVARGHEILAYCEHADVSSPIPGIEIVEISAEGRTSATSRINFARRIARDLVRRDVDIVHTLFPMNTHEGFAPATDRPLVVGPLNLPWPRLGGRHRRLRARAAGVLLDPIERRLHAQTLARASRILVTGATSRNAIDARHHERCVEIPFGVDATRFTPGPLNDETTILFFSVLQPRKGIDVLVGAMRYVLDACPRARLVVAGADPDGMRPALEERARTLGVAHAITFAGAVRPEDAAATYRSARVFCQPSLGEPFGMTVLEAMACGRPIVATGAGGMSDLIVDGKGGRLAPPGDERLLAAALASVLSRPDQAAAMGAFNRARVERRFTIERIVDRIELTYQALAAERSSGARVVAA